LIFENYILVIFEGIGLSPIYFRTKRQSKADKMRAAAIDLDPKDTRRKTVAAREVQF